MKNITKSIGKISIILLCILNSCKKEELPVVTTSAASSVTTINAITGGNILSDGGSEILVRGVCWSINLNPTISDSKTDDGKGIGQFTSSITGLSYGTTYHVRAYAINSVGTAYGSDIEFTTLGHLPSAATNAGCCVTTNGATLNGTVNANDLPTTVSFEYGTTTDYGSSIESVPMIVDGNGSTSVSASISDLDFGTTYHYRIKAVNSLGTAYGNDFSITTLSQKPTVATLPACCMTLTGVELNGTVNSNYLTTTVTFEYGITEEYGTSVVANPDQATGGNFINVNAFISGLESGTTYHFRVKAENAHGVAYGDDMIFTTFVIDIDGNNYDVVLIGNQTWMASNLKTTKYSNGDQIPNVTNAVEWLDLNTGAFCWYNNEKVTYMNTYGALYNWYAVKDLRNLCPTGWHVPTDDDWSILITYLGGENVAGGKLKETSTTHWQSPNSGATNETGFTAMASGGRFFEMNGNIALFYGIGSSGYWWSATEHSSGLAWERSLSHNLANAFRNNDWKINGLSVRCLKNN